MLAVPLRVLLLAFLTRQTVGTPCPPGVPDDPLARSVNKCGHGFHELGTSCCHRGGYRGLIHTVPLRCI